MNNSLVAFLEALFARHMKLEVDRYECLSLLQCVAVCCRHMKLEVDRHTNVFRWFSRDIFWRLLMTILHVWHDWDVFSLSRTAVNERVNDRPRSLQLVAPAHSTWSAVVYQSHESLCVAVCCSVLQCVAVCCSVLQCVGRGLTVSWESLRTLLISCIS